MDKVYFVHIPNDEMEMRLKTYLRAHEFKFVSSLTSLMTRYKELEADLQAEKIVGQMLFNMSQETGKDLKLCAEYLRKRGIDIVDLRRSEMIDEHISG